MRGYTRAQRLQHLRMKSGGAHAEPRAQDALCAAAGPDAVVLIYLYLDSCGICKCVSYAQTVVREASSS